MVEESERVVLSERDSLMVLNLLENPPASNAKLRATIAAMPNRVRRFCQLSATISFSRS